MAKSTHKGREHTMTNQFGFKRRPGHVPEHAAPEGAVPSFTYGNPGESGVRALAYGPQDHYFQVPFAAALRDADFPDKLARLAEVMRIREDDPENFDPLEHRLDGNFANLVQGVPVTRVWPKVETV